MATVSDIEQLVASLCAGQRVSFAVTEVPNPEDDSKLTQLSTQSLTGLELTLLTGLRSPKRRSEFYAGRMAAKAALRSSAIQLADENPSIGKAPTGAPYLVDGPRDTYLSITHSGPFAVATAASFPIGVDLELDEPRPPSFPRYFLTAAERAALRAATPSGAQTLLNHFWCRKEAACKVGGWGSALSFGQLDTTSSQAAVRGQAIRLCSASRASYVASFAYASPPNFGVPDHG